MGDYLKVVVTGEVDSGKSTLIGRFLYEMGSISKGVIEEIEEVCQGLGNDFEFAYLLDSFEEERKNNLTIDTTQVFCKSRNGGGFIFIDVPGHRELIKNMLSGSSCADIAILVVDVQKSIEEQTKRHAFILKFLGIEQILVVLNKMDLVGFKENIFQEFKEVTVEFFRKIRFQPTCFIPISAQQGDNLLKRSKNMPWYNGLALIEVLNSCPNKINANGNFRFPIQDIYNLNGEKVAVGEIISGKIKKGEKVKILPLDKGRSVKAIKVFNKNEFQAALPESIGLVLDKMSDLRRGQVICKPRLPLVSKEILAKLFCIRPVNIKENLVFRCATQEIPVQIRKIIGAWDTANLEPKSKEDLLGATDVAQIVMIAESPVVVEKYKGFNRLGRFVLKSNREICAVGIIL